MGSANGPGRKVVDNGSANKPKRPITVPNKPVEDNSSSTRGSANGPGRG